MSYTVIYHIKQIRSINELNRQKVDNVFVNDCNHSGVEVLRLIVLYLKLSVGKSFVQCKVKKGVQPLSKDRI